MPVILPIQKFLYTPLGQAEAHEMWVPDTCEVSVLYSCWQCETLENWWWPQQMVRLCSSISAARHGQQSPIQLSDELISTYYGAILRHKGSPFYERALSANSK